MTGTSIELKNEFIKLCSDAADAGAIRRITLSKPSGGAKCPKTLITLYRDRDETRISVEECLTDGKRIRKNHNMDELRPILNKLLSDYKQANLLTAESESQFTVSKRGKQTLTGEASVRRTLDSSKSQILLKNKNETKNYIFNGGEKWLTALGISDKNGRVHDKKQSKFRQINRFTELLSDVYSELPREGTLNVCDLCCGKSYLSFAVYFYLTEHCGRTVNMLCIDRKRDVIDYCGETARLSGADGLHFIAADIADDGVYENVFHGEGVDLTVSLHACDIATDMVLRRAVSMRSNVILSTPCCHHELFGKIRNDSLSFITSQPMLLHKLVDAATDGLRVKMLEIEGYRVQTVELIDPDETPKNLMIRAVRARKNKIDIKKVDEYNSIIDFLGISGSYYDIYR